jgi:hypothetical protein
MQLLDFYQPCSYPARIAAPASSFLSPSPLTSTMPKFRKPHLSPFEQQRLITTEAITYTRSLYISHYWVARRTRSHSCPLWDHKISMTMATLPTTVATFRATMATAARRASSVEKLRLAIMIMSLPRPIASTEDRDIDGHRWSRRIRYTHGFLFALPRPDHMI